MAPYRDASRLEVLKAFAREGEVRLEVAPRHVVLEVEGASRVTVTDEFLTLVRHDARRKRGRKPRSLELHDHRLVVARAVPTDDISIWYEGKPDQMRRVFSLRPPELLDDQALDAWRELDRLYARLTSALAGQGPAVSAQEFGRGADRVLVEDRGDRDAIYVRPMFRERLRKVMEVRGDGHVVSFRGKRPVVTECRSHFAVTVHGDNINFSTPSGHNGAMLWLPWLTEADRQLLAKRLGERVDQE